MKRSKFTLALATLALSILTAPLAADAQPPAKSAEERVSLRKLGKILALLLGILTAPLAFHSAR